MQSLSIAPKEASRDKRCWIISSPPSAIPSQKVPPSLIQMPHHQGDLQTPWLKSLATNRGR